MLIKRCSIIKKDYICRNDLFYEHNGSLYYFKIYLQKPQEQRQFLNCTPIAPHHFLSPILIKKT